MRQKTLEGKCEGGTKRCGEFTGGAKKSGTLKLMASCRTKEEAQAEMREWRKFHKAVGDDGYTFKIGKL